MAKRFYPEHLKRRRRRFLLLSLTLVSLTALVVFYYWDRSRVTWIDYRNEELKIKISYPETFSPNKLSEEGKKAKYLLRIFREEPPAIIALRYNDNLGLASGAAGSKDILDYLKKDVDRYYLQGFPQAKREDYGGKHLPGTRTAGLDFTYTGADGKTGMKQRLVIVVKGEAAAFASAYFISAQAPESDFAKSEKEFEKIINSFEFID